MKHVTRSGGERNSATGNKRMIQLNVASNKTSCKWSRNALVNASTPANGRTKALPTATKRYLFLPQLLIALILISSSAISRTYQQEISKLPDLVSSTSDEPIVAVVGQDAFISCVAKNLQNYTIIWRFSNDANAASDSTAKQQQQTALTTQATSTSATSTDQQNISASKLATGLNEDLGAILTAGRQRVTSDDRISIIQSHETWLLKITNVRQSDSGSYICHTNSEPRIRVVRILSVIKPAARDSESESPG